MTNFTHFVLLAMSLCYLENILKYRDQDVCCIVRDLPTLEATAFNMSLCKQFMKVMETAVCSEEENYIQVMHSGAK